MRFAEGADLLFLTVLFLHVGGAIVAFGPTFAFPILGAMGGKEPQHSNFALRVTNYIAQRLVGPLALLQGITGVVLVVLRPWNVFELWLALGIVLYVVAALLATFVGTPTVAKLIEATSAPPPAAEPGESPRTGPPPHVAALVRRAQRNGMIQTVLLVAIVLLMVYKPTL